MHSLEDFQILPLSHEDASSLHEMMQRNAQQFQRYFPITLASNTTLFESKKFITTILEDAANKTQFLYALKASGRVIGLVYLKELDWTKKEGEFAYCMETNFSGKGWISQAVSTIAQEAFQQHKLKTLKIIVHKSNIPSIRVAEKCGFTYIKTLSKEFTPIGEQPLDMELYELTQ